MARPGNFGGLAATNAEMDTGRDALNSSSSDRETRFPNWGQDALSTRESTNLEDCQHPERLLLEEATEPACGLLEKAQASLSGRDPRDEPKPFQLHELRDLQSPSAERECRFRDTHVANRHLDLDLRIEFGRAQMRIEDAVQLRSGSVVPLVQSVSQSVDLYANGRLVARGEVLVLKENFCVRVTELVPGQ